MPEEAKPAAAATTAADRLAKEPTDRLLTRLSVEQRATVAYAWANRAVRSHAPVLLAAAGMQAQAAQLAALPDIKDDASAGAARDVAKTIQALADAARTKEEQSGKAGVNGGPATRASQAMSYAVASVQAALGQTGLKVTATGGAVSASPTQVRKEAVDTGVNRALLAGKYGANAIGLSNAALVPTEEATQRDEVMAILKAPRRFG